MVLFLKITGYILRQIILFITIFILIGCGGGSSPDTVANIEKKSDIKLYFSQTNGELYGGLDETIIKDINSSKKSIYLAMYEFTNRKIEKALETAYNRGVKINIVTDDDEYYNSSKNLYDELAELGISISTDEGIINGLMHNKILVIDSKITWLGSSNFTYYSFYRNYENLLRVEDLDIAQKYKAEIEELIEKEPIKNPLISNNYQIYCSPTDDIENILIKSINSAKDRVYIMAFTFTSSAIKNALVNAKNRGVKVSIILDEGQASSRYSQYSNLKNSGIKTMLFGSTNHKLHNKVLIIDNSAITGSYNLTYSANHYNCENIFVVKNSKIVTQYLDYFKAIAP